MSETKHSQLPWHVADYAPTLINNVNGSIASCDTSPGYEADDIANAEFIVRAANSHADLLAACEAALKHLNFSTTARADLKKQLRAALAKATGEQQ